MTSLSVPSGMARTPAGLVVPSGMERVASELSEDNQRFLKVRDGLHLESLTGAVVARYLESTRVVREGVVFYEPKGKESHRELADLVLDELIVQCHRRFPYVGMTPELFEQLKRVKDPSSGKSYVTQMAEFKFGVEATALQRVFDKNGAKLETVIGLMGNIGNQWYQRELTNAIRTTYGEDPARYRGGIENFKGSNLGVADSYTLDRLMPLGVDELLGAYVEVVGEALAKISKPK